MSSKSKAASPPPPPGIFYQVYADLSKCGINHKIKKPLIVWFDDAGYQIKYYLQDDDDVIDPNTPILRIPFENAISVEKMTDAQNGFVLSCRVGATIGAGSTHSVPHVLAGFSVSENEDRDALFCVLTAICAKDWRLLGHVFSKYYRYPDEFIHAQGETKGRKPHYLLLGAHAVYFYSNYAKSKIPNMVMCLRNLQEYKIDVKKGSIVLSSFDPVSRDKAHKLQAKDWGNSSALSKCSVQFETEIEKWQPAFDRAYEFITDYPIIIPNLDDLRADYTTTQLFKLTGGAPPNANASGRQSTFSMLNSPSCLSGGAAGAGGVPASRHRNFEQEHSFALMPALPPPGEENNPQFISSMSSLGSFARPNPSMSGVQGSMSFSTPVTPVSGRGGPPPIPGASAPPPLPGAAGPPKFVMRGQQHQRTTGAPSLQAPPSTFGSGPAVATSPLVNPRALPTPKPVAIAASSSSSSITSSSSGFHAAAMQSSGFKPPSRSGGFRAPGASMKATPAIAPAVREDSPPPPFSKGYKADPIPVIRDDDDDLPPPPPPG